MFKVEISDNCMYAEISGNIVEISASICTTIKMIYDKLDKRIQEVFIDNVKMFIDCGLYDKTHEEIDVISKIKKEFEIETKEIEELLEKVKKRKEER